MKRTAVVDRAPRFSSDLGEVVEPGPRRPGEKASARFEPMNPATPVMAIFRGIITS